MAKKNVNKGTLLFGAIILIALSISIGWDYIKFRLIEHEHRYTIGYVTSYQSFVRSYNNRINYYYMVDGKKYESDYRDISMATNLEGKRIIIKYSTAFKSFNVPLHTLIVVDSIIEPISGWDTIPSLVKNE